MTARPERDSDFVMHNGRARDLDRIPDKIDQMYADAQARTRATWLHRDPSRRSKGELWRAWEEERVLAERAHALAPEASGEYVAAVLVAWRALEDCFDFSSTGGQAERLLDHAVALRPAKEPTR